MGLAYFFPKFHTIIPLISVTVLHFCHLPQAKDHEAEKVEKFWAINSYVAGSYTEESAFQNLNSEICKLEAGKEAGNRLFYLALPPSVFADVTKHIKATCMSKTLVRKEWREGRCFFVLGYVCFIQKKIMGIFRHLKRG